jgi:hypothetical protein
VETFTIHRIIKEICTTKQRGGERKKNEHWKKAKIAKNKESKRTRRMTAATRPSFPMTVVEGEEVNVRKKKKHKKKEKRTFSEIAQLLLKRSVVSLLVEDLLELSDGGELSNTNRKHLSFAFHDLIVEKKKKRKWELAPKEQRNANEERKRFRGLLCILQARRGCFLPS